MLSYYFYNKYNSIIIFGNGIIFFCSFLENTFAWQSIYVNNVKEFPAYVFFLPK